MSAQWTPGKILENGSHYLIATEEAFRRQRRQKPVNWYQSIPRGKTRFASCTITCRVRRATSAFNWALVDFNLSMRQLLIKTDMATARPFQTTWLHCWMRSISNH